jgi:ubiquitin C-terminal hydrolase
VQIYGGARQVCHRGKFSTGHYWSFNRRMIDDSSQWFKCDDSKVDKVTTDEVMGCRKEVYLLLYSRDAP